MNQISGQKECYDYTKYLLHLMGLLNSLVEYHTDIEPIERCLHQFNALILSFTKSFFSQVGVLMDLICSSTNNLSNNVPNTRMMC